MDFSKTCFAFGEFVVDPSANSIIRNGSEKRVEPQLICLLGFFAENAKRVVSREDILAAVWPGVVVGNEAVTRAIFSLRLALGDDAKNPRFIETVPKKGYRFLVEVEEAQQKPLRRSPVLPIGVVVLLGFAFSGLWILQGLRPGEGHEKRHPVHVVDVLPVTQTIGEERDINIDVESGKLAYVYDHDGQADIYVQFPDEHSPNRVTRDDWKEFSPHWLDRNTLVYVRCDGKACQLVRKHRLEQENVLFESEHFITDLTLAERIPGERAFTWLIFNLRKNNAEGDIIALNFVNGQQKILRQEYPNLPQSARHLVYVNEAKTLFFVDVDGQEPVVKALNMSTKALAILPAAFDDVQGLSANSRGSALLLSATQASTHGIWQYDVEHQTASLILRAAVGERIRGVGRDEIRGLVYFDRSLSNDDLIIIGTDFTDHLQAMNSNAHDIHGVFDPTGQYIYFVSERSGFNEVWRYELPSGLLTRVTDLKAGFISAPILSPDGRYAAISYDSNGLKLAVLNVEDGETVIAKDVDHRKYPLSWAANGQYFYASDHQSYVRLYRFPIDTLEEVHLRDYSGLFAQEDQFGQKISYVDYKKGAVVTEEIGTGIVYPNSVPVPNLQQLAPGQLKVSRESVFVVRSDGPKRAVYKYPVEPEIEPVRLFDLFDYAWVSDIDIQNQRVLVHRRSAPGGDIMKIVVE